MREAIAVYDITAEDLGLTGGRRPGRKTVTNAPVKSKTSKASATAAYRDSQGNTWGGRGPRPRWLKDALAGGAKLEDFAH
ncbi:H-NS family nucleoid-associated regulatory protein [Ramlibacter henchirensis]